MKKQLRTAGQLASFAFVLLVSTSLVAQELTSDIISGLNARKIEDRAKAQREFEKICLTLGAPGNEFRESACKSYAQILETNKLKVHAKIFVIKQLERVGRTEVLASLSSLLKDERAGIRDAARRALANNPAPDATRQLIEYFESAEKFQDRRATLSALGYRGDEFSMEFLTQLASKTKGPMKLAAINALSASADETLKTKILRDANEKDALIRFADRLAANGKKRKALGIYQSILKNNKEAPIGLAALRGVLEVADEDTVVSQVLSSLSEGTKTAKQVAIGHMRSLAASGVEQIVGKFDGQSAETKAAIIMAIGTRRDGAGRDLVAKVAASPDETLRRTAIEALGGVGDASSLSVLLPALKTDLQDLASGAIMRINDVSVDAKLISAFHSATSNEQKSMLLRLLTSRRAAATPIYVSCAKSDVSELREIGVSALMNLGEPDHVNAILDARKKVSGADRDRMEKRIVNMCRRLPKAGQVLAERFENARMMEKLDLVSVLGRIGSPASLDAIRGLLKSSDDKAYDAATSALANWPNHEVAGDLKRIAQQAKNEGQRIRALRGLARVGVLGGDDAQKLDYLKFVFANATRLDEKNLALERAKAVRTVDSLNFVLPHVEDAELGARAQRTVVDLAHHRGLREPNRSEFEPALKRVAQLMEDERQQERIRKYLANE